MRGVLVLPLLVATILVAGAAPAFGNLIRNDVAVLEDTTLMGYRAEWVYGGNAAGTLRDQVAGADGQVNESDAAVYLEARRAELNGSAAPLLSWDGSAPTWWGLEVSATGLTTSGGKVTLAFGGKLLLSSSEGEHHTFTIQRPSSLDTFTVALSVPGGWSIEDATGLSVTAQSNSTVIGDVTGSLAVIEVSELPPAPTPDENDTTPPVVNAGPDQTVAIGDLVAFDGAAADDPPFPAGASFWWTFLYNNTPTNFTGQNVSYTFWALGEYLITFTAMDASGNTAGDTLRLLVQAPDLEPPTAFAGQDRTEVAGNASQFVGQAQDNDANFPEGARFAWSFTYNGTTLTYPTAAFSFVFWVAGHYTLTLEATDAWGNTGTDEVNVTVVLPDSEAPTVQAGADTTVEVGRSLRLSGFATDNDPAFPDGADFWWTFSRNGGDLNVTLTGLEADYSFTADGAYAVTLWASDAWGNTANDTLLVQVTPTPSGAGDLSAGPAGLGAMVLDPLFLLGVIGLVGASVAGAVSLRRRFGRAALQAADALAGTARPAYVVEAVLILNRDGRLIHFQASGAEGEYESPEVIGSMFTAVTEFIRDSFGKEGALSGLTYGQNTIVLERSRHLFGAVIVYGEPGEQLGEMLTDVLRRLEVAYAGLVERWTGDREAFEGIEGFVAPLIALTAGLTRADVRAATSDKTVRLGSGTEHFKGYIRLRLAMVNQTESLIRDTRITVLFNQSVLRLAHVEPAGLKREGLSVYLGDIAPGERVGASYYLDPQSCSQTNIEGVGTYTDASGGSQTVKMKPRLAEIVCPLFFTPEHANPAMMRRLIDTSLDARDSRVYRVTVLPEGLTYGDFFGIAREAVQRHHVVLVRNIKREEPFEGNAWFYGQTKHSRSPAVIRVTVSEKRRAAEFFVAVDSPATLTGMLAEFHRSFAEIVTSRAPGVGLEPVLDDSLKVILSAEGLDRAFGDEGGK